MAGRWIVAVSVWGDWYIDRFLESALPSLKLAAADIERPRFIVHTDNRDRLAPAFEDLDVQFLPVPAGATPHHSFAAAHRQALEIAQPEDRLVLTCADVVISRGAFAACEARFARGYRAIVCHGTRTAAPMPPPIGAEPRALLDWTMEHPHPIVQELFWGAGRSNLPSYVYFRSDTGIMMRGFHLHPFAVVKPDCLRFSGTIDDDLLTNFEPATIHVVTSPDELACAEMTPPGRRFGVLKHAITTDSIAQWAARRASPLHWWLSRHRIMIRGEAGPEDIQVWDSILARPSVPAWAKQAYSGVN